MPLKSATLRKLEKDPVFHSQYVNQLVTLLEKGFARQLEPGELEDFIEQRKSYYFMSHQMVVFQENKSTSIRVVFNSSQKYGFSLNESWILGPDMMTNLQITLLRFRRDLEGAQGDIAKMFYQVRVCKQNQMMQFKGEKNCVHFACTIPN